MNSKRIRNKSADDLIHHYDSRVNYCYPCLIDVTINN